MRTSINTGSQAVTTSPSSTSSPPSTPSSPTSTSSPTTPSSSPTKTQPKLPTQGRIATLTSPHGKSIYIYNGGPPNADGSASTTGSTSHTLRLSIRDHTGQEIGMSLVTHKGNELVILGTIIPLD